MVKTAVDKTLRVAQDHFARTAQKRKRLPQVEDEWLPEQHDKKRQRQRTLVLEGPSGVGKTEYAKSLFGYQHTLEVNCASGGEVNLKELNLEKHKAVLLDEASPQMMAGQRKLFQCPAAWISLGNSATNCHSYEVCLYGIPLIICSNKWTQELEALSAEDREWVEKNTVHIKIKAKLYDTDSEPKSAL